MREYITKFLPFEGFETKHKKNMVTICGYGNVFCARDFHNDVINRGSFKESLDMHYKENSMPHMLLEHKNYVCGQWSKAVEDDYGLRLEGVVNHDEKSLHVVEKITNGSINGLSIGFYLLDAYRDSGVRYITKAHLIEISLVTRPANDYSRFFPVDRSVNYTNVPAFGG